MVVLEQKRDKKREQNLILLNDRLVVAKQLLENHIYWGRALSQIESLLQDQVQLKIIGGTVLENRINIEGEAVGYTILARQIAAFLSGEGILDVSIGKATSLPTGRLGFEMRIDFDKLKFMTSR